MQVQGAHRWGPAGAFAPALTEGNQGCSVQEGSC